MLVIGITGGVGTGKSTVSSILAELGSEVIYTDRLAHQLIRPDGPAYAQLLSAFGSGILARDGSIDRHRLAQLAFAGREEADRINSIVHPLVVAVVEARLEELARAATKPSALVLDVPLLYESGLDRLCDLVWVVDAQPAVRSRRVAKRDGAAASGMLAREAWQMPMAEKIRRADAVIDNSGCRQTTRAQVERLWCDHVVRPGGSG